MAIRLSLEEDRVEETHEINVTPFIDVILVLLIIFMVAAPLSTVDVNVDLPASTAHPAPRPDKPVFLTVKADLSLALGDDPVSRESLAAALDAATKERQGAADLRSRRPQGRLWRRDGIDESVADRRLSQDRARRLGGGCRGGWPSRTCPRHT